MQILQMESRPVIVVQLNLFHMKERFLNVRQLNWLSSETAVGIVIIMVSASCKLLDVGRQESQIEQSQGGHH